MLSGTNSSGVTETYLDITNIGTIKKPTPIQKLEVNINVNPEPSLSTDRVEKAKITIDYDSKAAEKYYRIGSTGELQTYNGEFEVTTNCTIYAYAKGPFAAGQASKNIDNLIDGISEPYIVSTPNNKTQASKVSINISYDKYATVKRYSIDGGSLRDYTGAFEVTKNGSVIYAYSENVKGQKSNASYKVENIVPEPPVLVLDKGSYYLLKLNYPEGSNGREYKWKADGSWVGYKEAGILLIKPQFKDQLIQNGTLVKIEDESGNLVTFTGDYYFIDVPISELFENLFMRWDRIPLDAPQIVITPTEPAISVTANIVYNPNLVTKQYKIVNSDGSIKTDWTDYTGPITINRNNTMIYAKGMDDTEVWTSETMKKVTNIDENPPVIKLTADLDTAMQKVAIKVNVTDDVAVGKVKWAQGTQGESYFINSGTEITNNSIVNITSNGYYTFYAEDKVGNKQVYTLNVLNVDLTAPKIDIQVSPDNTVGVTANVIIDYGDSTIKQYKIGTSNATWTNYTTTFAISSYTILTNNWKNADGTVTIYAKGKDTAGNEITVQKKVVSLDLDKPNSPVVTSNSGYPVLTEYGVEFSKATTITYDTRTDIDNYYSIDNGITWLSYTGQFDLVTGTVIAKSVKKNTGLEVVVSKTVAMPVDALMVQAYDGNESTYTTNIGLKYIKIDSSMQGKSVRIKSGPTLNQGNVINTKFLDLNKNVITTYSSSALTDKIYQIPVNATWINFADNYGGAIACCVYEIQPSNEPTFSYTNGYMLLHADSSKAIKEPYQMVTINYFATSGQRLYKIGTTGEWLNYQDQPIKVKQGQTIYTKGIDKYGTETRVVSTLTANAVDALKKEAYDRNESTYTTDVGIKYVEIDSSLQNKKIRIKAASILQQGNPITYSFLDSNKVLISKYSNLYNVDTVHQVPSNAKWISFSGVNVSYTVCSVHEIQLIDEPTFNITNVYMLLTADPTNAIRNPYQNISISYSSGSVQKLYRIGTTGEWLNYSGSPIGVNLGATIYAKGIDQYGVETRIISSYTVTMPDALKKEAYDGNETTYTTEIGIKNVEIDSSMQGKSVRIKSGPTLNQGNVINTKFLDSNKNVITTYSSTALTDKIYQIPSNAKWINFSDNYGGAIAMCVYEIQPSNEPTFSYTNGYMLLHLDSSKVVNEPYQMISVSYFPTSAQRLYRIGATGEWLNYQDQPIKVKHGQTIYAKGIDQYGTETRVISTLTVNAVDALKKEAYDKNESTYTTDVGIKYVEIDSSLQNKKIRIKAASILQQGNPITYSFLDSSKTVITTYSNLYNVDTVHQVPSNAKWIKFSGVNVSYTTCSVYEIQLVDEPTFSISNVYMLLTSDSINAIKNPYQNINISYSSESVQKLYRIGTTGEWLNYSNNPISVSLGATIYAKGIDQYGVETRIVSSYTVTMPDALKKESYDGNETTYTTDIGIKYISIDSSMQGKNVRIKSGPTLNQGNVINTKFLDSNKNVITAYSSSALTDKIYQIPSNAKWISFSDNYGGAIVCCVYEIQPSN